MPERSGPHVGTGFESNISSALSLNLLIQSDLLHVDFHPVIKFCEANLVLWIAVDGDNNLSLRIEEEGYDWIKN